MVEMSEEEKIIILEFCHLLDKSKRVVNGLRDLPKYGHRKWHSYFGRAFDVFSKLWKFQHVNRNVLDSKYGLKRWQIGEIGSKIGQLFYHFYLRTSETIYLIECFSFYHAIHSRNYYAKANRENKAELMVKKLRYYARFIVVCLLMRKLKLADDLVRHLGQQIIEYGRIYDPGDQIEWIIVLDEMHAFIRADALLTVLHPDNYPLVLSYRLKPEHLPAIERTSEMSLNLAEIVIVGCSTQQVRFSELTIDMYRMLQTLERDNMEEYVQASESPREQRYITSPDTAPHTLRGPIQAIVERNVNPHKYLLFKPTPIQVLIYLNFGCMQMPANGALLLYMSAEGYYVPANKAGENSNTRGYDVGGILPHCGPVRKDVKPPSKDQPSTSRQNGREPLCLHPGDLWPCIRYPIFMIVDSDSAYQFGNIPPLFGQPHIVLMSPKEFPAPYNNRKRDGNIFTLFLNSPVGAFCYLCDINCTEISRWERGKRIMASFMSEATQLLLRSSRLDPVYFAFIGDEFFRLLTLRYIFCEVVLRGHRAFVSRNQFPRSMPPMPEEIVDNSRLVRIVLDLAKLFETVHYFHEPASTSSSQPQPSTSSAPP